jgi:hypothetical protein
MILHWSRFDAGAGQTSKAKRIVHVHNEMTVFPNQSCNDNDVNQSTPPYVRQTTVESRESRVSR